MPIFWRPQFRIGHDDIDSDHRYLVLLLNTVELVLRHPDDPHNVELALAELRHYAEHHFEREERIQIAYGYVHFDRHKQEHRHLLADLDVLIQRIHATFEDADGGVEGIKAQSGEITALLRKWLVDHVMKSDMQLAPLFVKKVVR